METHLARVMILWLPLALYVISICRGDIRYIVTEDFFNTLLSGGDISALSIDVGDIATQEFFNGILSHASDGSEGKKFYRYSDFISATNLYPEFGTTGSSDDRKREIAAFFATVAHVTGNLSYVEAINKNCKGYKDCCDPKYSADYPCAAGKQYYGRGPLQLTWNNIYANAGRDLGFNGLKEPEIVAQDRLISWKTALWSWMKRKGNGDTCHSAIISGQGFGETIKTSMGTGFCGSNATGLIDLYTNYCSKFVVEAGSNLTC